MQDLTETVKSLINHLNQSYNMKYALGHAFSMKHLFMNFKIDKLKITKKECNKLYNIHNKRDLGECIFRDCVKMVIDDIIENEDIFELPTTSKKSVLRIKRFTDDVFIKHRQNGRWKDVDVFVSNYSGHQMVFEYQFKGGMKWKPVYLDPKRRDKILERTNEGVIYY